MNPRDPDSSNPRIASFVQSETKTLFHLIPDSSGKTAPSFYVFIGVGKHGPDKKYRPTIVRGIYDLMGSLPSVDTMTVSQATSSVVPVGQNPSQTEALEIISIVSNPARNAIQVRYLLGANEPAKLELFNTLGVQVGILSDGYQTQGVHSANLIVSSFAEGTYYLRLSTYNG